METIDFEQRVTRKIRVDGAFPDFPKPEDYGTTREEVDDYLFDKQVAIDSAGSPRSQYTLAGILIILPVIIVSAFPEKELPWGSWSLFVALGIGFFFAALAKIITRLLVTSKLKRISNDCIERYIDAVLNYRGSEQAINKEK